MKKLSLVLAALAVLVLSTAPIWAWGPACPLGGASASCPPMTPASASKIAPLLIALAAGYGVLALAAKQTRRLSIVGLVIGWFILAVAFSGLLCTAAHKLCMRCHDRMGPPAGACPYMEGKGDSHSEDETEAVKDDEAEKAPASAPKTSPVKKK